MSHPPPEPPHDPKPTPAPLGEGPCDPHALLSAMREMLADLQPGATGVSQSLSHPVLTAFEQIVTEHQGMADELLSVYEQLGIIFEVTRQLPTVSSEEATIGLFVDSLRRSFAGRSVLVARPGAPEAWTLQGAAAQPTLTPALAAALNRVCRSPRSRTQVVELEPASPDAPAPRPSEFPPEVTTPQVMVGPVYSGDLLVCALLILRDPQISSAPPFKASDMNLLEALTTFCGDLIRTHRLVREMREMSVAMVRALVSAVDQKDRYTCGHSLRVGHYATILARLIGLSQQDLQMLQWSALLHDVGKIGIRDDVLNKQGRLTQLEFDHIKEHPERSHRVVQQVPQLARALDGILHHHERFDGKGYPSGLKGDAIPLQARIIQIADVFDALTSSRSYRPAYSWAKALDIMQQDAGTAIDPTLQQLFDQHLREALQSAPDAWERLVREANAFTTTLADESANPFAPNGGHQA